MIVLEVCFRFIKPHQASINEFYSYFNNLWTKSFSSLEHQLVLVEEDLEVQEIIKVVLHQEEMEDQEVEEMVDINNHHQMETEMMVHQGNMKNKNNQMVIKINRQLQVIQNLCNVQNAI